MVTFNAAARFCQRFWIEIRGKDQEKPCMIHPKLILNPGLYVRFLVRSWIGGVVLGLTTVATAQDSLVITTNFFNVSGASERELRRSINLSRPWKDRREADASTEWKIEWTFRLDSSEKDCQLQSFTTKTSIAMTLPRWMPRPPGLESLTQQWERYLTALRSHEEGHKQIALAAVAEIRRRVKALKSEATCEALSALLNRTAKSVIAEYRQKEVEYDRNTDHGATQGARFP